MANDRSRAVLQKLGARLRFFFQAARQGFVTRLPAKLSKGPVERNAGGRSTSSPADLSSAGRRTSIGERRSGANADDRIALASLGRIQGGDGIVQGRDLADVGPQSSVTHPLDDLTQL